MKLKTLINIYHELNQDIFANVLTPPIFRGKRWRNALAQYIDYPHSVIEFNNNAIVGFDHARAVVYHEMIHQYIEEYLGLDEDDHHGVIFWRNYRLFAPKGIELNECL